MKLFVSLLAALAFHTTLFAQRETVKHVIELIQQNNYPEANRYLDSILKKSPRDVDALMMKGNVILNYDFIAQPDVILVDANTESVFDTASGISKPGIKIIPAATVRQVENLWLQCLAIDSTRKDIREGLCSVYAMALMKEQLKREIINLLRQEKNADDELAYNLANYARKFKERGKFDEAIEVYQFIANQFPGLAGIRSDMAWECFYEGRMNDALRYIDSALSKRDIDESTYLNCAFAYAQLGYFENAHSTFTSYSGRYHAQMDMFYRALMMFGEGDRLYRTAFKEFMISVDSNAYISEYRLALDLLKCSDTLSTGQFRLLLANGHPDWYNTSIYQRAMKDIKNNCEPFVQYGLYHNRIRNYSASVQLLQEGENCEMPTAQKEAWFLNYGYAAYLTGDYHKALVCFAPLFASPDIFKQHAAKYFSAKIYTGQKRMPEAQKLSDDLRTSKQYTKYVAISQYLAKTKK